MTWLHFIGKQYYSTSQFIEEAKKYGVSRRISFQNLKNMRFGDKIYLFQWNGKSSELFGYFVFERILGINHNILEEAREKGIIRRVADLGDEVIKRGCGNYILRASYTTENPEAMLDLLEEKYKAKEDLGKLMIGGAFYEINPHIKSSIPFQMGFRSFDITSFMEEYERIKNNKRKKVKGSFFLEKLKNPEWIVIEGGIIEIQRYKRREK